MLLSLTPATNAVVELASCGSCVDSLISRLISALSEVDKTLPTVVLVELF